jgi:hypothetical protein
MRIPILIDTDAFRLLPAFCGKVRPPREAEVDDIQCIDLGMLSKMKKIICIALGLVGFAILQTGTARAQTLNEPVDRPLRKKA